MAIHNHSIREKEMTLPGYDEAYAHVARFFDNFGGLAHSEGESLYANDPEMKERYERLTWHNTLDEAFYILMWLCCNHCGSDAIVGFDHFHRSGVA